MKTDKQMVVVALMTMAVLLLAGCGDASNSQSASATSSCTGLINFNCSASVRQYVSVADDFEAIMLCVVCLLVGLLVFVVLCKVFVGGNQEGHE